MSTKLSSIALAAFVISCCDASPVGGNNSTSNTEPKHQPIEGYGELKFGSTFMEAIGKVGSERFNSYGVKECLEDLPLKGCFLSPASDASPFLIEAGIPYKLGLDFNKFDKLTDIRLSYDREGKGKISFDECLSLHERTLDWLTKQYGQLRAQLSRKEKLEQRRTPGGNFYSLWRSKDGSFVAGFMRTAPPTLRASIQQQPITKWDNERHISLLSHFILVDGKPMCTIGVEFNEPDSVERRPQLKDAVTSMTEGPETEAAVEPEVEADGEPIHDPYPNEEATSLNRSDEESAFSAE